MVAYALLEDSVVHGVQEEVATQNDIPQVEGVHQECHGLPQFFGELRLEFPDVLQRSPTAPLCRGELLTGVRRHEGRAELPTTAGVGLPQPAVENDTKAGVEARVSHVVRDVIANEHEENIRTVTRKASAGAVLELADGAGVGVVEHPHRCIKAIRQWLPQRKRTSDSQRPGEQYLTLRRIHHAAHPNGNRKKAGEAPVGKTHPEVAYERNQAGDQPLRRDDLPVCNIINNVTDDVRCQKHNGIPGQVHTNRVAVLTAERQQNRRSPADRSTFAPFSLGNNALRDEMLNTASDSRTIEPEQPRYIGSADSGLSPQSFYDPDEVVLAMAVPLGHKFVETPANACYHRSHGVSNCPRRKSEPMSNNAEYNHYATDEELQALARERACRFIQEEQQFHLGFLPTEQGHPLTRDFARSIQADPSAGIAQLLLVDGELTSVARRAALSREIDALIAALHRVATATATPSDRLPRVCFSGCGSTGRLAIALEEMWRFAFDTGTVADAEMEQSARADQACSIMTGGDRALIRSVENFEDYRAFGARQVADLKLAEGDILVAVSEGGETSSVIGTVEEALRRGCTVFFIFNNPRELLIEQIERSRRIIEDPRVTDIDLFSGPMALSGSTRMQATTIEMLVLGIALEEALVTARPPDPATAHRQQARLDRVDAFARLVLSLSRDSNRETMARLASDEADLYTQGGLVTYIAGDFLLDIFSDTTERSPTFMLPPFRPSDDQESPLSWSFAKDPRYNTQEAWLRMLRREPRGISWTEEDYRSMNAPSDIAAKPPTLDAAEIYRYAIGREADPSRWSTRKSLALWVDVDGSLDGYDLPVEEAYSERRVVAITTTDSPARVVSGAQYKLQPEVAPSPIRLFHHLAMKLIFNTVSTGSMGMLGRIRENWMIQVDPTNKKLVDRGSRIISQLAGLSYEDACYELHVSLEARRRAEEAGRRTTTSPVVAAMERLDNGRP